MGTLRNRAALLLGAILALGLVVGCSANPKPVTTPLPTSARDQVDANAFRIIADAHALLKSIQDSVTAGKLTLTPAQKGVFNKASAAYNVAYTLGMAYHNGTSTDATALNNATSNLQTQVQAASAQITVPTSRLLAPNTWDELGTIGGTL